MFQKPEETKGFFTKAYDGLYQEYYTDLYYLAVGKVEKPLGESFFFFFGKSFELEICPGENLEREMVRKVNIMVPVYDDTCFNFCGKLLDTQRLECKKKWCQELGGQRLPYIS